MTKDEALKLALEVIRNQGDVGVDEWLAAEAAIEKALAAPAQEPVALKAIKGELCYLSQEEDQSFGMWCPINISDDLPFADGTDFYTAPHQRQWVGLTDDEFHDLQIENIDEPWANFKAIEAKLKEKNHGL